MRSLQFRNAFVAFSLFAGLAATSAIVSCRQSPESETDLRAIDALPVASFENWCGAYKLQNCSVQPDDRIPADQWQAGVDVFAELMESLTTIKLSRADFDRKTVQDLFSTFGANSTLSFVSKIPWQMLAKEDNTLVLRNSASNAVATFNSLRLIGAQTVYAKFVDKQLISIRGLQITDSVGGQLRTVTHIDLSRPSRLTLVTDRERITDIPVQFFQVPGFQQPPTLTPSAAFNSIANVVLEPGFDWRKNLHILLNGRNLRNIYARIQSFIPEGSADETTRKIIENTTTFMVGGASSDILISMQMSKPLKCTTKISNIPVLGNVNFDIDFLAGFGLSDLVRVKSDGVKTSMYGVTTSIGRVENIEVDAKQMRMKIGMITVPIDFKPSAPGSGGPRIDAVLCR
ncbi:MAG: hypothetical protein FJY29_12100 [Betaproteobacteria bacterium]|nr:hypothetical protein [Betaproteobacteria bacterium]